MNSHKYFLYKTPKGNPVIVREYTDPAQFGEGYSFMGESEQPPNLTGAESWIDGEWVYPTPHYTKSRSRSYPSIGDQLDSLWHAMDRGELPKISEFYDPIKEIKDNYPK